jgi:hypothetical protein
LRLLRLARKVGWTIKSQQNSTHSKKVTGGNFLSLISILLPHGRTTGLTIAALFAGVKGVESDGFMTARSGFVSSDEASEGELQRLPCPDARLSPIP